MSVKSRISADDVNILKQKKKLKEHKDVEWKAMTTRVSTKHYHDIERLSIYYRVSKQELIQRAIELLVKEYPAEGVILTPPWKDS
jgi:hypothetical protein